MRAVEYFACSCCDVRSPCIRQTPMKPENPKPIQQKLHRLQSFGSVQNYYQRYAKKSCTLLIFSHLTYYS